MSDYFDENEIHHELYLHLVWSTKDQQPVLSPFAQYLYRHLCDLALTCGCNVIDGQVFSDHIQLVVKFSPDISLDNLIKTLKVGSNMLIRTNVPEMKNFEWQGSDFSFTVCSEEVCSLIDKNAKPFTEEICALLSRNNIKYDLQEVLD